MSFVENQNYKKKVTFHQSSNEDNKVTIALSLSCNHDIDKTMISSIEQYISNLFLNNYISDATLKEKREKSKLTKKENKQLADYKKRNGIVD